MTTARAKKLENEAFQAEVNAMKMEYDALMKKIADAKKRMDDLNTKGKSLTDKVALAANK
jgi:peptidoglycan hydrolase CwlO-like protein